LANNSSKSVSSSHGLTSKVTIDLAAGFGPLAAFLAAYSANLCCLTFSASSSTSSSSEPNKSTSSSSSSAADLAAGTLPAGKSANSSVKDAMWLNHLANCGNSFWKAL